MTNPYLPPDTSEPSFDREATGNWASKLAVSWIVPLVVWMVWKPSMWVLLAPVLIGGFVATCYGATIRLTIYCVAVAGLGAMVAVAATNELIEVLHPDPVALYLDDPPRWKVERLFARVAIFGAAVGAIGTVYLDRSKLSMTGPRSG